MEYLYSVHQTPRSFYLIVFYVEIGYCLWVRQQKDVNHALFCCVIPANHIRFIVHELFGLTNLWSLFRIFHLMVRFSTTSSALYPKITSKSKEKLTRKNVYRM